MWVIEGAFDGEPGNLERKKTKLLKPGRTYTLGRKAKHPLQLVISHPKVSAEQITFVVGEHSIGKVDDPSYRPTLGLQNCKNKALQISRTVNGQTERVLLQGLVEEPAQDGDVIAIVTGIYVSVHWKSVVCYTAPRDPIVPLARCAALGLKVVSSLHPEVTHHLTPTLSATAPLAISLLSQAHFVQPDWLTELLHLGETASSPEGPSALEQDFRLPSEADYRPPFNQELPPFMKSYLRWEPSKKRASMMKGWRFLFIGEKNRELDSETRTIVERGDGQYETFDAASGAIRWKQCLTRNQRKADDGNSMHLCIIGDKQTLNAISPNSWAELEGVLEAHKLQLFSRTEFLEAIFATELDRINSSIASTDRAIDSYEQDDSPLPSIVPNTHEIPPVSSVSLGDSAGSSEPASSSRSRLRKRVTPASEEEVPAPEEPLGKSAPNPPPSETPAPDPEIQVSRTSQEPEAQVPRRKPLVRRARTVAPTSASKSQALDENSQDASSATKSPSSGKPPSQSSATAGRSVLLRKRARDGAPRHPIVVNLEEEVKQADGSAGPMLKKYRQLFEETNPERAGSQYPDIGFSSGGIADSQMLSNVPSETLGVAATNGLSIVQEEEEEESLRSGTPSNNVVPDTHMYEPNYDSPLSPRKKPPTTETASESQHPPPSGTQLSAVSKTASSKTGAAPGKPDTDAAFLKAIASTKKGKRREDDFDREFNNLRISVPERDKDEHAEEWKVLADFEDESNILGNYMVIMEMDIPEHRKGQGSRAQSRETETPAWRGKPDFKKFKKKANIRTRPSVELVVDDENDYGMGAGYWKTGSQSQSQNQPQAGSSQVNGATNPEPQQRDQSYLQPSQTQNRGFLQPVAPPSKNKKNQTQTQITSVFGTQTKAARGKTPDLEPPTLRARSQGPTKRSQAKGKGKSKQVLSDVDDSDVNMIVTAESGHTENGTTDNPLFLNDAVEESVDLDLNGFSVDEGSDNEIGVSEPPTLRSQSQRSTLRSKKPDSGAAATRSTNSRKRGADLIDDDSDTGVAFAGFGAKKKARPRY